MIGLSNTGLASAEIARLKTTLHALLTMRAPYLEQSVRGGIQTDRNLFFHPDPVIQRVRTRATAAIRTYVQSLPPAEPGHPLLGVARDDIAYEGSWSVLLAPGGYHAAHTHNRGWISSALHIDLPPPSPPSEGQSGWLAFGTPPGELNLGLDAVRTIEPKVGQLVLFPSTMWHRTLPIHCSERLSIAFDVKVPDRIQRIVQAVSTWT